MKKRDVTVKDVFISYRREGGTEMAHLLHHRLENDGYAVFMDRQLESGRYDEPLYKRIEECTDFLLVVSPKCFDECTDPKDWVRREIKHALLHEKNIIPVCMSGCTIPEDIPESVQEILFFQAVEFEFKLVDAEFEWLERMMHSKPRASIADLNFATIDDSNQQQDEERALLHEKMSQRALWDESGNADRYVEAIRAANGDAEAQYRLGIDYLFDYGYDKAVYWLNLAASQNHPDAICTLGKCYYYGCGVKRHPAKAVTLYRKSLEYDENLTEAMWSLGDCYLHGIGVSPDVLRAMDLYKQAMEAGDTTATGRYLDLIRTSEAREELSVSHVVKKIKSMVHKKEKTINLLKVCKCLMIWGTGVIRYDFMSMTFLIKQIHTIYRMTDIDKNHLQKYQKSMDRREKNVARLLLMAAIFLGMAIMTICAIPQESVLRIYYDEMPNLFLSKDFFVIMRGIWASMVRAFAPFISSYRSWGCAGIVWLLIRIAAEIIRFPEVPYFSGCFRNIKKMFCEGLLLVLLWYFDPFIAILIVNSIRIIDTKNWTYK